MRRQPPRPYMTDRWGESTSYQLLRQQAKDKILLVAPPYPEQRVRAAFIAGYEAALADFAKGWLTLPRNIPLETLQRENRRERDANARHGQHIRELDEEITRLRAQHEQPEEDTP